MSTTTSTASEAVAAMDDKQSAGTRCEACRSCGAALELDCGHRFHPRCVYAWPLSHCEQCAAPVTAVRVVRAFRDAPNSMARKGKWSADEHKYANMMMKQFQAGALPLVDGLHLRGFIASVLQCDPLRVTKKYTGHAIGKQNFFYQRHKGYCYNLHVKLQKRVSSLRNHFYWHIQYRCKLGLALDIQQLKAAEADYWVREFLRFAAKIGQKVEMAPAQVIAPPSTPSPASQPAAVKVESVGSLSPSPAKALAAPTHSLSFSSLADTEYSSDKAMLSSSFDLRDVKMLSLDLTAPSSKELSSADAVSPLGFDEWTDPAIEDMASEMAFSMSQPEVPMDLHVDVPDKKRDDQKPVTSKTRLSIGHWIEEADGQWREAAMSVPSWSFSQLSEADSM